jgi:hypothetical protein
MIDSRDLAKIKIRRIIFHDVPTDMKGGNNKPDLVDAKTEFGAVRGPRA